MSAEPRLCPLPPSPRCPWLLSPAAMLAEHEMTTQHLGYGYFFSCHRLLPSGVSRFVSCLDPPPPTNDFLNSDQFWTRHWSVSFSFGNSTKLPDLNAPGKAAIMTKYDNSYGPNLRASISRRSFTNVNYYIRYSTAGLVVGKMACRKIRWHGDTTFSYPMT